MFAIFVLAMWIICVSFHEYCHALVAYAGGDSGVKARGYLSFNFLLYIDPFMSIFLPMVFFALGGIGLPGAAVYIDKSKLRGPVWESAVAAAGPIATALITVVMAAPFLYPPWLAYLKAWPWVIHALAFLVFLNSLMVILNLLPLPPLDGFGIIEPWLNDDVQSYMRKFGMGSLILLYFLMGFVPPVHAALMNSAFAIMNYLHVPIPWFAQGYEKFRSESWLLIAAMFVLFLVIKALAVPDKKTILVETTATGSKGQEPEQPTV